MKLYVGNLPWSVDEAGLRKLFESYNPTEVSLIKDKFSGRSKGFGFITISDDEVGKKAISEMNGKENDGRALKVTEAIPMDPDRPRRPQRSFGNRSGGRNFGRDNDRRRF